MTVLEKATMIDDSHLRSRTLVQVDEVLDAITEFDLPSASAVLLRLRERLEEDYYRCLVVGEAKNGKSSLINAMIGQAVLPTDVEVATSQVFQVRSAVHEACRVRFEDGSTIDIARSALERYGSQVADSHGEANLPEVAWIEVDLPSEQFPDRIVLCDTPGLGSLHAAHGQVTQRFLPLADAVLFVLDSSHPIIERELALLESVLECTEDVFFIQTKIDQHSRDVWEEIRQRNEKIIAERFPQLADAKVWPVSSKNLLAAVSHSDSAPLLFVSRYPDLSIELDKFVEKVCGTPRAVDALIVAYQHHKSFQKVLDSRLNDLTTRSQEEVAAGQEWLDQRWQQYQAEWGAGGHRRAELVQAIKRLSALGKQSFREALSTSGPIAQAQMAKIDNATSVAEVNELGQHLGDDVVAAAVAEWTRTCRVVAEQCACILEPFLDATDRTVTDASPDAESVEITAAPYRDYDAGFFELGRLSWSHAAPLTSIAAIAAGPAIGLGALVLVPAIPAILWAFSKGWQSTTSSKAKAAKTELQRYVGDILRQVSSHFLAVELLAGRFSRADEYFAALEINLVASVDRIAADRVADLRSELARRQAQAAMEADERAAAADRTRSAVDRWSQLGSEIAALLQDEVAQKYLQQLIDRSNHSSGNGSSDDG